MQRGKFISIDGSEGCGKSTQIRNICQYLRENGKSVHSTREPGGTPVGEKIREILLDTNLKPAADTELLLLLAARKEHLEKEILPRLAQGEWIVSDRFNDATYAYQGFGRRINLERIRLLETWSQQNFQPDLSILLNLDIKIAEQRVIARGEEKDRFEQENHEFFTAIRQGYIYRAQHCEHVKLIDAEGSPEQVFARIIIHLEQL